MPRRLIPLHLIATDDHLPPLPPLRGLLCTRPNLTPQGRIVADAIAARYFRKNDVNAISNIRTKPSADKLG